MLSRMCQTAALTDATHRQARSQPRQELTQGLLPNVSLVVPIGPGDLAWQALVGDLTGIGPDAEVLFVGSEREPADFHELVGKHGIACPVRWIATSPGRARQMNVGAGAAIGAYLWFLHCDSRLGVEAIPALDRSLTMHPMAIHYFDLAFLNDGPAATRLNEIGVRVRSHILGMPFGDQGLCLSRVAFERLGRFNEDVAYGEDHLLVWAARRHRLPLRSVGAMISTSGRRYAAGGWLSTTATHLWRTCRQAAPEAWRWLWSRI